MTENRQDQRSGKKGEMILIGLENVSGRQVKLHVSRQLTERGSTEGGSLAERMGKEIVSRLEKSDLVLDDKEELA